MVKKKTTKKPPAKEKQLALRGVIVPSLSENNYFAEVIKHG